MKLTRIGINYVIEIKNIDFLSPSLQKKGYENTKFIEDNGKKLELVISDNLSFEELSGAIVGMHGLVGFKYYSMFESQEHIEHNKNSSYDDFVFYDINDFLYKDIGRLAKTKEKVYLTVILSDYSLLSFELIFKQTVIQPKKGEYNIEFWKIRNKFQAFTINNINLKKLALNQKQTVICASDLIPMLFAKGQFHFRLPVEEVEFDLKDSIMSYNSLATRQELQTASRTLGAIYEWRESFNDPMWIQFMKHDFNDTDLDEEFASDQDFDEYEKYLNDKQSTNDLKYNQGTQKNKKSEVEIEGLKLPNENLNFDDLLKIKSDFLNQLIKMINDLHLDDDEVRHMLEEFISDLGQHQFDGMKPFNVTKEEKESFINEVFAKYKELKNGSQQEKKNSNTSNDSNLDDIN
ncbi:hypothetical protein [Metamycoplasma auris]|uniref:Uncharacterized protein n=1 Tax=Metamycoplasma auris TaxID=51363 RepID=A0A2W7GCN5_9BACT|nr:hypothetical protein [Metamycoplasma auris]PZW01448.1 hypothetical protein BCF89_10272 [Metamycoplasma auris]